jgi:hypothetical protein
MELELNLAIRFPAMDHGRALLHVVLDLDSFARTERQIFGGWRSLNGQRSCGKIAMVR